MTTESIGCFGGAALRQFGPEGNTWPVLAHHSPGASPGRGVIVARRVSRSTGSLVTDQRGGEPAYGLGDHDQVLIRPG